LASSPEKQPAIIVSNNAANKFLNRVQVIPLTSNTEKLYPGERNKQGRGNIYESCRLGLKPGGS